MRYSRGEITVTGNPSIAWIRKMEKMGMRFTLKDGRVIAFIERSAANEKVQIKA